MNILVFVHFTCSYGSAINFLYIIRFLHAVYCPLYGPDRCVTVELRDRGGTVSQPFHFQRSDFTNAVCGATQLSRALQRRRVYAVLRYWYAVN